MQSFVFPIAVPFPMGSRRLPCESIVATYVAYGPVAQLVRALACHARGHGFEPRLGRDLCEASSHGFQNADLAHLVERDLAKVEVAGSSPVIRFIQESVSSGYAFLFFNVQQFASS